MAITIVAHIVAIKIIFAAFGFCYQLSEFEKTLNVGEYIGNKVGPAKGGHWEIIKKQNLGGK